MFCRKCKRQKKQVCRLSGVGFFDVSLALKIIGKSPRKTLRLVNKELEYHLSRQQINPVDPHLKHTNKKLPAIVGQVEGHRFLLDGNHRALEGWLNNKPVYYYLLTEFETGRVFQEKPPKNHVYIS